MTRGFGTPINEDAGTSDLSGEHERILYGTDDRSPIAFTTGTLSLTGVCLQAIKGRRKRGRRPEVA
jgi:hypothetical protein